MNIVICGCGEVGAHTAEVLADQGHSITVIDFQPARLAAISDQFDVRTLEGNCADASILREAGAAVAGLVVATTDSDEVNILSAAVAKGMGAAKVIARVHDIVYFEQKAFEYKAHFGIDRLICPEFSTATAIAQQMRNPAAIAIEHFARGAIDMQEFPVSTKAAGLNKPLAKVALPTGTRIAAVHRDRDMFIPIAGTEIKPGDRIVLVGNADVFYQARKLFQRDQVGRRKAVVMGGSTTAVWLCRELRDRNWAIRLFERDRERAEALAEQLDWVTVIHADPTDRVVFQEENLGEADAFVAVLNDDETNIMGCLLAKSMGVTSVIAVVQKPNYLDLLYHIGIDRPFSPRMVAVREIEHILDTTELRQMSTMGHGSIDAYTVQVTASAAVLGKALWEIQLSPDWIIAAIRRGERVWVPAADDTVQADDTLLVIGKHGEEKKLRQLFSISA